MCYLIEKKAEMKDPSLKVENSGKEKVLSLCKVSLRRVIPFSEIVRKFRSRRVGNTGTEEAS